MKKWEKIGELCRQRNLKTLFKATNFLNTIDQMSTKVIQLNFSNYQLIWCFNLELFPLTFSPKNL